MQVRLVTIALSLLPFGPALAATATTKPVATPTAKTTHAPAVIVLPGGQSGIGFDDLGYSKRMGRLLVPAGRTGKLHLVDPETGNITSISGFSTVKEFNGGHDDGITSVAEGAGLLFVVDRTSEKLSVVDPATQSIVSSIGLSAGPDYVRWLEPTHELWVTEPDSERIEIFRLEAGSKPRATAVATIEVPGGPESLIIDAKRGRAYTHVGYGKSAAIDIRTRKLVATWSNGCSEAKGMALDGERGLIFVACEEGAVTAIDAATGNNLGTVKVGGGIDIIAYSPSLGHVYVPSRETAALAILGVSRDGALALLGTFPGTKDSHCVAAAGKVFFADPARGRLVVLSDPYPRSMP